MKVRKFITILGTIAVLSSVILPSSPASANPSSAPSQNFFKVVNIKLKCIHAGADTFNGDDPRMTATQDNSSQVLANFPDNMTDGQTVSIINPSNNQFFSGDPITFKLEDRDDVLGGADDPLGATTIDPLQLNIHQLNVPVHISRTLQGSGSKYQLDFDIEKF